MNKGTENRAYNVLNYLASAVLIAVFLFLALHRSGSEDRTLIFGRWSLPFFQVLLVSLATVVAHFALFKFARVGRKLLSPGVILAALSLLMTIGLVEVLLRVSPIPHVGKGLDTHPILFKKFESGAPGHDSWGWRNEMVPESAKFVFLGDSQTYGAIVSRENAIPQVFERLSGASTYNLALGGYGPLEYRWTYNEYGHKLSPEYVVVGIYLGNDLIDVIQLNDNLSVFGIDEPPFENAGNAGTAMDSFKSFERLQSRIDPGVFVNGALFLRERSIFFRLVDSGHRFSRPGSKYYEDFDSRLIDIREILSPEERGLLDLKIVYPYDDERIRTIFTPVRRLIPVFSGKPDIDYALPIMEKTIAKLDNDVSVRNGKLVVLLIPTKEEVYFPYLRETRADLPPSYELLIDLTSQIKQRITQTWRDGGICVIDVTQDLQSDAMSGEQMVRTDIDGHFNQRGNTAIAASLLRHLQEGGGPGSSCPTWP